MPSASGGSDGSTMRRKSCASASVRPLAPSHPNSSGSASHSPATISADAPPATRRAWVARRRARATSCAPSAGATSAVTAIAMPMPAEIMKNRMLLA